MLEMLFDDSLDSELSDLLLCEYEESEDETESEPEESDWELVDVELLEFDTLRLRLSFGSPTRP